MQAFFANFPNKLTLNFPQNIVHQIFHEMSNILYIPDFPVNSDFPPDFPDFPDSPQIFQFFRSCTGSADFPDFPDCGNFPQIFRVNFSRFSMFWIFQIFRQIFRFTGSARFSADFSACQIFRQSASMSSFPHKKKDWIFPVPFNQ